MKSKFIKVKCIGGFHVIRVKNIITVCPHSGQQNKTEISVQRKQDVVGYYSTETVEEIELKILENEQQSK
jgi:hypothetical protein